MMNTNSVVFLIILSLFLCGCAANGQVGEGKENPDLVLFSPAGKEGEILAQVVKSYEKQNRMAVKVINVSEMDFASQLWASLLSQSNQWDSALVPTEMIPQMVDYKGVTPVEVPRLPAEDSQDTAMMGLSKVLQDVTVDGEGYGLTLQYDVPVLLYRKDILDQQGITPPQDWNRLLSTIRSLKSNPAKYAYVIAPGGGSGGFDFAIYLAGFGGTFIDEDGRVRLDDDRSRQAFSFYVQMIRDPGLVSTQAVKWGHEALVNQLRSGDAAMGIVWLSDAASLMDCQQSSKMCSNGQTKFGMSPIPGVEQNGAVKRTYLRKEKAWVIPGNARHAQAAKAWLDWLASEEGSQAWAVAGGVPFNPWAVSPGGTGETRQDLALLVNALPESMGMPEVVDPDGFWSPIHEMVNDAVSAKKTSDQALKDATQTVKSLLAAEGKAP